MKLPSISNNIIFVSISDLSWNIKYFNTILFSFENRYYNH
eukprot:UN09615